MNKEKESYRVEFMYDGVTYTVYAQARSLFEALVSIGAEYNSTNPDCLFVIKAELLDNKTYVVCSNL